MKVQIKNKKNLKLPKYATEGASCMDICMDFDLTVTDSKIDGGYSIDVANKTITIYSGTRILIRTGINVAIPEGYEIQVRGRSGLGIRNGISITNGIGTIDSDYRGDIGVIISNTSNFDFTVGDGDRIAQIALVPVIKIEWDIVDELPDSNRNIGGFGHTGIN